MKKPVIELKHLSKSLNGQPVLSDINLVLDSGEIHGLVGDNGAGKSVLVNLLSGVYPPDLGEIHFQGEACRIPSPQESLRQGIVSIYQQCSLIPNFTVAENLCMGRWLFKGRLWRRIDWDAIRQHARTCLKDLNCGISEDSLVSELSYGQQRLVEITRALSQNARVLIMDEPYENLTPAEMQNIQKAIGRLCRQGVAVLYISQRIEELLASCSSISILQEGTIAAHVSACDSNKRQQLAKQLSAHALKRKFPRIYTHDGRVVLDVQNLSTGRGLNGISFQLKKGEVLGIAGRLGSGRTALARALFGIDPLTEGSIRLNGSFVKLHTPADAVRLGIGYIPDGGHEESLFPDLGIAENITIANLRDVHYGAHLNLHMEQAVSDHFREALFIRSLDDSHRIRSLSNGNRQKVLFSRWIFTNSRILIMDEPTKGIDKSGRIEIYNLINKLVMDGNSVILISSDFYELMGMSDRLLVMNNGCLLQEIPKERFCAHTLLYDISG